MRSLFIPVLSIAIVGFIMGCKSGSSSGAKTFCDTTCLKDSIKFTGDHKLKPYVYISASDCGADTLTWSYYGMGSNRKIDIENFMNKEVYINKDRVRCVFNDTAYAWLLFNDCATGRGYQMKLLFSKTAAIEIKGGSINNIDPKFSIDDNLVVYTDRGNLFVEDMLTGKKASMTFGKDIKLEYDRLHDFIDSVNITPERIWAKVKIDNEWKELEKKVTLE